MTSRIPRHRALAEDLVTAIGDGTYAVGTRLPTEAELAVTHGMARETVRRALDHVQGLGLIDRRPSAGTTVVAARPVDQYRPVAQSAADVVALAESTRLLHPVSRDLTLDTALARRLGTRPGTTWHLLEGARVVKGHSEPICFSEHYLRGDLDRDRMLHGGGPDLSYAEQYRVEQTVSAAILTKEQADALAADSGAPALVIARRVRDRSGRLLNIGVHTHPADRFQITTVLEPGDGSSTSAR
jgi:DNA-binding GntR family transcriptional regulator